MNRLARRIAARPRVLCVTLALLACAPLACGPPGVTDVDGNRYPVIRLGAQTWIAENLRATRTPSGEPLVSFPPHGEEGNVGLYGRLYPWESARRACPTGWHLPSDAEWSALERFLGAGAGVRLRDRERWPPTTPTAEDAVPFRARPAGYANDQGFDDLFGSRAVFWTATAEDEHFVWSRVLASDRPELRRATQHPQYGFSVRCVGDP